MTQIQMFADLSCPFAYVVHHAWREVRADFSDRVELAHKCRALEYVKQTPTPKPTVEAELTILLMHDPDFPYLPWLGLESEWPVTILPAFEAVKCAERQGSSVADDLAWEIRSAFFAESRCISMRHTLLDLASRTDLDLAQFEGDFD